ncbi:MAG: aspartate racemase [Chitinophagales bacterium]
MKTIGLIGGMSWESTRTYYSAINQGIKQALGGLHSAKIAMVSLDFAEIENLQRLGKWTETGDLLVTSAQQVEAAGADFIVLCTNTMHKVVDQIEAAVTIPILHIADAIASEMKAAGISKVGLLGTKFTMEQDFYKGRLQQMHSIDVIVPNEDDQLVVHNVIYQELVLGVVNNESRQRYIEIITKLSEQGAQGVILGCTEIALLVEQNDTSVLLFDTTGIHSQAAVEIALAD